MANISTAILAIDNDAVFTVTDNDVNQIEWLEGTTPIASSAILSKVTELQAAEDAADAQKETDKTNAKAKLKAGQALNDDEIAALFG